VSETNPQYKPGQKIWRASNIGQPEGVSVTYTPSNPHVHERADGTKLRGCQVWSINGDNMTVKVRLETHINGERTVARSLAPNAIVGDGLIAEVTGTCADDYVVVALHDAIPTTGAVPQAQSVAALGFNPGAIPPALY